MYSEANLVEDNRYRNNMVGVFLMYSDGVHLRGNHISGSLGPTGDPGPGILLVPPGGLGPLPGKVQDFGNHRQHGSLIIASTYLEACGGREVTRRRL